MFNIRYKSHHDVKNIISQNTRRNLATPLSFYKILNSIPKEQEGGIYVHTPFCDKICSFCNMNRKQLDNDLNDYVEYLCKEFERYGKKKYVKNKIINTIFFGGGTPTIYKDTQLEKILSTLRKNFIISKDCEFTFETTLHNLTDKKIEVLQKYGVNRLSIGIQTFSDRGRKLLNRTYIQEKIIEKIKHLQNIFKGNICIDIIYNYLDESDEEVLQDAEIASSLGVDSVSFYSLMIHDGSKISKDLKDKTLEFDYQLHRDRELHHIFLEKMLNSGYSVLEHTKLTKGSDKYRYIQNVNSFSDLFAIGMGAGGRVGNIEYFNLNKFVTFYAKDDEFKYRVKKLSGILQFSKVSLVEIKNIVGDRIYPDIMKLLKTYSENKLITFEDDYFVYTYDGVFWGNSITASLVEKMLEFYKK